MTTLSQEQARRIALHAQGFGRRRPDATIDRRHMRRVMNQLRLIQLDSVPVIIRTQYMPFFARLGAYDADLFDRLAYRDNEWFEVWAHEASVVPVETEPLLRWAKARSERGETWANLVELANREAAYVESVYDEIAERGPVATSELSDPRPRDGDWWGSRSLGQLAADWLFRIGRIGVRRTPGFEKVYDTIDRIVPETVLRQPTPTEEEAHRQLLLQGAAAHGVGSAQCIVDYFRLPKVPAKQRLAELVEDGRLLEVEIEGWKRPGLLHPDATRPRRVDAQALLSPFDPIVWNRDRASALFDFDYKIEIYVPKDKRRYGYYVLPFLLGDQIVARVDLKTDRKADVLRVLGAFAEDGVDRVRVGEALGDELTKLAALVGVTRVEIGDRGDLIDDIVLPG